MTDSSNMHVGPQFSKRRILLTLLGAFGAFAVMTASYATAELPAQAATQPSMELAAGSR